jgi:hypothetical protein
MADRAELILQNDLPLCDGVPENTNRISLVPDQEVMSSS